MKTRPTRQEDPAVAPLTSTPSGVAARFDIKTRKVGKKGAVTIAGLPQGISVNVATVDSQTYLVSSLPIDELRALTAAMPKTPKSPFAAIAESVRGRKHAQLAPRYHGEYVPFVNPHLGDEDERELNLDRTRREQ